jgi:bifunctional non-homologous end joining protein LigD
MAQRSALTVEGTRVTISNLEKLLYPAANFNKAQVIDYYIRVADYLLPHLKNRPVTLKRYPDGVKGKHFYEKDAPAYTPEWVQTYPVPRRTGGPDIRYILINDLRTLVWVANLANLEIHPFLHCVPDIHRPTYIVFDLDPGEGADVLSCARVALRLKSELEKLKLESYAKVSGSKGMQVYVPLNTLQATYAETQPFARTLAGILEKQYPDEIVSDMPKALRRGKVFIDWSQNTDFKTTVGVYSLRAKRDHPFVSMPVEWSELESALADAGPESLYFPPDVALQRLEERGDLFASVLTRRQSLRGTKNKRPAKRVATARAEGTRKKTRTEA